MENHTHILNSSWVKEEIRTETKISLYINKKNIAEQNGRVIDRMVSLGKFLAISAFIGMKESLNQINLSAQEARQTTNPKLNLIPYLKKYPQTIL